MTKEKIQRSIYYRLLEFLKYVHFTGLTSSVGLGNFKPDVKSDAFSPWGAFAGINLGEGKKICALNPCLTDT